MTDVNNPHILQTQLEEYTAQKIYPLHMPGHKRRVEPAPGLPVSRDMTEVPGMDDLHDAHGILRQAMERTAELCGADRTWYLVNGSTCGLLAGIRALASRGSEVVCARNCHKAVYHALELAGYHVHWIQPPVLEDWQICGGISAGQVNKALRMHPSAKAVILTSPTYEGVLSEVEEISRICHEKKIPVLVDEAHGAHLMPLSERAGFPAGALARGADLVVQSPHKTLPSMTQTALLHLQGRLVDPARIEAELDIFETSSPSYPLMASLDGCTGLLREQGKEMFENWARRLGRFASRIRTLNRLRVLYHGPEICRGADPGRTPEIGHSPETSGFPDPGRTPESGRGSEICCGLKKDLYDPGKILIDAGPVGMTGQELAAVLRREWKMETEMTQGPLVLAMTSPCDSEDALDRLAQALLEIDQRIQKQDHRKNTEQDQRKNAEQDQRKNAEQDQRKNVGQTAETAEEAWTAPKTPMHTALMRLRPTPACSLAEAAGQASETVPLTMAAGRICAEYLYFYPPGIPLLAPGELITHSHLDLLKTGGENQVRFYRHRMDEGIRCLRE